MADLTVLAGRLDAYMGERGLKHTRQRQVILETLAQATKHLSLDELLAQVQLQMPGIGYATVYRAMKLFTDAGVAYERRFGDGQPRYEPAGVEDDSHHDHLICVVCGHIFEFEDPVIEERQAVIARQHGLQMVSHRLDIWGRCESPATCQHRGADRE